MSFLREGLPLIAVAALVAAGTYALALNRRSWPLWLLAFALTIAALWVAYFSRDPAPAGLHPERTVTVGADLRARVSDPVDTPAFTLGRARPGTFSMIESNVPVDDTR